MNHSAAHVLHQHRDIQRLSNGPDHDPDNSIELARAASGGVVKRNRRLAAFERVVGLSRDA